MKQGPEILRSGPAAPSPAFTLVEFLAAMAIVALLGALLLPAVTRGKAVALRVTCVQQLRQLGLAAQMYWDDHNGQAFSYRGVFTNGGDIYWFGWLERGTEGRRRFDLKEGALYRYLPATGVTLCPAFRYAWQKLKLKATGAAYGYGYNLHLSGSVLEPAINIFKLPRPATTALLADAAQVNGFQPPATPSQPLLEEFYYINRQEPTVHFRHQTAANVLFCDGHVGRELPVPGSLDPRLPQQQVGRLRPELFSSGP